MAANLFRATQTEEKRRPQRRGDAEAVRRGYAGAARHDSKTRKPENRSLTVAYFENASGLIRPVPPWTGIWPDYRDIRLQSMEMQALIDADIDRTAAARLLMRMQADLVLFIENRERLQCHAAKRL